MRRPAHAEQPIWNQIMRHRSILPTALALAVFFYLSTATHAQTLQSVRDGGTFGFEQSWALSSAGDVDGDGIGDLLAGCPDSTLGAGTVQILSVPGATLIRAMVGEGPGQQFGASVAGGVDVNGDGVPDVLVGAPGYDQGFTFDNRGRGYLFSGADGSLLHTVTGQNSYDTYGSAVCFMDDVDLDGTPDFAVAGYGFSNQLGKVHVVSGATGIDIYTVSGSIPGSRFGYALDTIGDIDGDGLDELLVGAPYDTVNGGAGRVYVLSGATGAFMGAVDGLQPGEHCGTSVCGSEDLNGDSIPDIIVGCPDYDTANNAAGCARAISGADGSLIWQIDGPGVFMKAGMDVDTNADMNMDGINDVLVGMPYLPP